MPVRNKALEALVRKLTGGLSFNSIDDVAFVGPLKNRKTISMDEFYMTYDAAFVACVDSIDWNRVLLEATQRHLALKHENQFGDYGDEICPECINEAVLGLEPWNDWADKPLATRQRRGVDYS